MRKFPITMLAALVFLLFAAGHAAWADGEPEETPDSAAPSGDALFSAEELDDLLAPIALYPDPLLAQILPAATFIDQIDEAARQVAQYGKSARIDDQPWDVSVKAVAHYPDVLFMMDQKYDWTESLGQAYLNQQAEVMDAIQRLRAQAEEEGNLASTPQQEVDVEEEAIRIVPAEPDMIYVPRYDPLVVYTEPSSGFITFGMGWTIGAWLNRDCDWHGRRVYYHGWSGGGWIGRARPRIQVRNSIYINNNYAVINIDRGVKRRDTGRYREANRRDVQSRRELPGQPVPAAGVDRPRPVSTGNRPLARPGATDVPRGRDIKKTQPESHSGYGGYGSRGDAATYRERGQASRAIMRPPARQQPAPVPAERPSAAQRPSGSIERQPAPAPVPRPAPPPPSAPANRGGGGQRQLR
jgi:hypothetical protein